MANVQNEIVRPQALDDAALDILFRGARSHKAWLRRPVPENLLHRLYDLLKWGPTSVNGNPARIVFVVSPEEKEKLLSAVSAGNVEKTRTAPVTAVIGYDPSFWTRLPHLFPHKDMRPSFADDPEHAHETAFRNGALQGAYLMIAARALGLDVGPMSGFDHEKIDASFFPDGAIRSNFLCNIGYGDAKDVWPRGPRLAFDEACRIV